MEFQSFADSEREPVHEKIAATRQHIMYRYIPVQVEFVLTTSNSQGSRAGYPTIMEKIPDVRAAVAATILTGTHKIA